MLASRAPTRQSNERTDERAVYDTSHIDQHCTAPPGHLGSPSAQSGRSCRRARDPAGRGLASCRRREHRRRFSGSTGPPVHRFRRRRRAAGQHPGPATVPVHRFRGRRRKERASRRAGRPRQLSASQSQPTRCVSEPPADQGVHSCRAWDYVVSGRRPCERPGPPRRRPARRVARRRCPPRRTPPRSTVSR